MTGRPPLPLHAIYAEALALIADSGVDGLGMRALARRMGCSTSTLYRQLPGGRDELGDRLGEEIMAEIVVAVGDRARRFPDGAADGDGSDWGAELERAARISFEVLNRHPHAAGLFIGPVTLGPMGRLRYEHSLRILLDAGLSPRDAAAADHALARLIVGYALQVPSAAPDAPSDDEYLDLDPSEFRAVRAVAADRPADLYTEFDFAVRTFICGLRHLISAGAVA